MTLGRREAAGAASLPQAAQDSIEGQSAGIFAALAAACFLLLIIPVLAVPVPPLTDYPNHLARAYVLASGDPVVRRMFAVHWAIIPNLAVDVLLPPLMRVLPVLVAGRVVVAIAVLLPVSGVVALGRACFGRFSAWQLGAGFVAYNTMFLIGTLNFQVSVGVALWGAAIWVALAARPVFAVVIGIPLALLTFVCHLYGFGFYALLIGAFEISAMIARPPSVRNAMLRLALVALVLAAPAWLYLHAPFASAGGATYWQSWGKKWAMLLVPVLAYTGPPSLAVAIALLAPAVYWRRRRQMAVAPMALLTLAALLLIYVLLPVGMKGGYWIDTRIPVLIGFAAFALTQPRHLPPRAAMIAAAALGALFAARIGFITWIWLGAQPGIAQTRAALALVEPGARVLVVDGNAGQRDSRLGEIAAHGFGGIYWHYGAFALLDRRAFWSDAFALPGQQPVVTLPPYDQSGDRGLKPPRSYALLEGAAFRPPAADPLHFMDGWPGKFDFVLLLNATRVPDHAVLLPGTLTLMTDTGMAALYRVRR